MTVCFRGKKRITLQSSVSRCFESERGCMTSASCPRQTCTLDAVRIEKLNSNSTRSDQDWRFTHLQVATQETLQKGCLQCNWKTRDWYLFVFIECWIYVFRIRYLATFPPAVHVAQEDVARRLLRLHVEFFEPRHFCFFVVLLNTTCSITNWKVYQFDQVPLNAVESGSS